MEEKTFVFLTYRTELVRPTKMKDLLLEYPIKKIYFMPIKSTVFNFYRIILYICICLCDCTQSNDEMLFN